LRQDEAGAVQALLQSLGYRHKVVAVGAKAVQPNDACVCGKCGLKDQGFAHLRLRIGARALV
jgi:hypothetical protein